MNNSKSDEGFHFSPRANRASEINWYDWDIEPFERAQQQGKLVLLSISASWCHWCHVMDETTFSHPDVIRKINEKFIAVRVDSDKRPDINRRYNQGGWPTIAFLLPNGAAIAGLTYAPPEYFSALLDKLSALYASRKEDIEVQAALLAKEEEALYGAMKGEGKIPKTITKWLVSLVAREADRDFGGLGSEPKFPPTGALEFSLSRLERFGDGQMKDFVISTLDGMLNGGLFDSLEGGFFRYSTTRDWSKPHYEKMLEDNAELSRIYLAASRIFNDSTYENTARKTIEYCLERLYLPDVPGFGGSQDADEQYYMRDAFGRKTVKAPAVDLTLFVDANSLMISSLAYASAILNMPFLLDRAVEIADFIWKKGFLPSKGLCHYFPPVSRAPKVWGEARDQVFFLKALLDLYQIAGSEIFLERAVQLADLLTGSYLSEHGWLGEAVALKYRDGKQQTFQNAPEKNVGGQDPQFYPMGSCQRTFKKENLLSCLPVDMPDIKVNGIAIISLVALEALIPERLAGDRKFGFKDAAQSIAESLSGAYERFSHFAAWYAMGVDNLLKGNIEVRISPDASLESESEILRQFISIFDLRTVVRRERVDDFIEEDSTEGRPMAVICAPGKCISVSSLPDIAEIKKETYSDDWLDD